MLKEIMSLGIRIRTIRENLNLSIVDFAEKLSVSSRSISYYEKDEKEPTFSFLEQLVSTFNVSPRYILIGDNEIFLSKDIVTKHAKVYEQEEALEIGKRINQARKERGLILASVSDSIDISVQDLEKWEKGKISTPADVLKNISRVLGVSPCWLLTGNEGSETRLLTLEEICEMVEVYNLYFSKSKDKSLKRSAALLYDIYRDVIG